MTRKTRKSGTSVPGTVASDKKNMESGTNLPGTVASDRNMEKWY